MVFNGHIDLLYPEMTALLFVLCVLQTDNEPVYVRVWRPSGEPHISIPNSIPDDLEYDSIDFSVKLPKDYFHDDSDQTQHVRWLGLAGRRQGPCATNTTRKCKEFDVISECSKQINHILLC